uniref:Putative product n=1 Tax=Xenopsylla cheopis TaxID=163159 RepID=A0A6M2DZI2_XENCH
MHVTIAYAMFWKYCIYIDMSIIFWSCTLSSYARKIEIRNGFENCNNNIIVSIFVHNIVWSLFCLFICENRTFCSTFYSTCIL